MDGGCAYGTDLLTFNNCTFTSCNSTINGGCIYTGGTSAKIESCKFVNCFSMNFGGVIYGEHDNGEATLELKSTNISQGNASSGGGIYSGGTVYFMIFFFFLFYILFFFFNYFFFFFFFLI
jgi:hypothetical protein